SSRRPSTAPSGRRRSPNRPPPSRRSQLSGRRTIPDNVFATSRQRPSPTLSARIVREGDMAYQLEGRLLEVCSCKILCPCWVGEDPDFGTCDGVLAWHFDKGSIDDVDVVGRTFVILAHIPGNILKGNWKIRVYIDDKATAP